MEDREKGGPHVLFKTTNLMHRRESLATEEEILHKSHSLKDKVALEQNNTYFQKLELQLLEFRQRTKY
jgi:hypothetical protein